MARPRDERAAPEPHATAAAARYRATVVERLPARSLARLGALLGLADAGAATPEAIAAALAKPGGGKRLLDALRAPDRRAFASLFRAGGIVLLAAAKDFVPGAGIEAARKSLGALLEIGLLARLRVAGTLFITIPPGLHDLVAPPCREALRADAKLGGDPKEPLDPGPPLRAILAALLSILEKEPLRVTQTGSFYSRQVEKVAAHFKLTAIDQELLVVLVDLLARFDAVRKTDGAFVPNWTSAREFLSRLDDAAAATLLTEHAMRSARPLVRLLSVVATLDVVATEEGWIPLDALVARDFPVLLSDGFEAALAGGEDLEAMREDVLARVTLLAASRLLEMAGPEPGARPSHVRPGAPLRALLSASDEGRPAAPPRLVEPRIIVQPSFDVLVPADATGETWAAVAQWAELREADRVSRFSLTQARLYKALDAGPMRLDDAIAFLATRSAHGLPQNVEQSIRSWAKGYGEIEFVEGLVAKCRTKAARESLLSVKDAVAEELGDGVYLLKPGCLDAVLKKAEADGHTPSRRVRRASPQPGREAASDAAAPVSFPDSAPLRDAILKVPPPRGTLLVGSGESLPVDVGPDRPAPPPPQAFKKFLRGVLGEGLSEFLEFVSNRELRELQDLFLSGQTPEFEKKLDRILERYEEEERLRSGGGSAAGARGLPLARSPLLGRPPSKSELLDRLTAAVDEAADIEIEYREGGGAPKKHRVTPEEIVHRGVTPYLGGYCHETGEQRLFKLSLITRVRGVAGEGEGDNEGE